MPDIKKLTDKNDTEFYPRTVMDAVYDSQTGRTLANGVPASRYRSFTINNPVADTSVDGFEYSQTFDWDNVLATDEASADIVSGYSSDYSVGVETLQDSIKLYFDEDPTGAVIRVILYPASIGNISENVAAALDNRVTALELGDVYSTTERVVGRWIDGKPLYQKTFVDTLPNCTTNGTGVSKDISLSSLNIEKCFIYSGYFYIQSYSQYISMPVYITGNGYQTKAIIYDGSLRLVNAYDGYNNGDCYITIRYTKTTD